MCPHISDVVLIVFVLYRGLRAGLFGSYQISVYHLFSARFLKTKVWLYFIKSDRIKAKGNICTKDVAVKEGNATDLTGWNPGLNGQ